MPRRSIDPSKEYGIVGKAVRISATESDQRRFSILSAGVERRVFTYGPVASNGSLVFRSCLPGSCTDNFSSNGIYVDSQQIVEFKLCRFNDQKVDRVRARVAVGANLQTEFNTVEFDQVPDALTLLTILPTSLDSYPETQPEENYTELSLCDERLLPPRIQIMACRDAIDMREIMSVCADGNWFVDRDVLRLFGLDLFVYVQKHRTAKYPKQEARIVHGF